MIRLELPGMRPCAKARPRVTANGTYMPHAYQEWRSAFRQVLHTANDCEAWNMAWLETAALHVAVTFTTPSGSMRPDLDNAMGAVWDAMQDAEVIGNDRQIRACMGSVVRGPYAITIEVGPLGITGSN